MAMSLPDKGEGQNDIQSIFFQEYLDVLLAGINGIDCVLSGGACTAQGTPDMTVAVAKAGVLTNGALKAVAAANATIGAADATNPRIDLVVINSSGAIATRAGTAAAAPKPPARTANDVVLCSVFVPATDTTISSAQITDMRVVHTVGPITIGKVTTPVDMKSFAAAQTALTVTMPSGLFLSGKVCRVRMGGWFLLNSGTPIVTLILAYDSTVMFQDAMIVGAADADEGGWWLEVDLVAKTDATQSMQGFIVFDPTIAQRVAPTSGIAGNLAQNSTAANQNVAAAFSGEASVNSDNADRALTVKFNCDVNNAADQIYMEYATVELL